MSNEFFLLSEKSSQSIKASNNQCLNYGNNNYNYYNNNLINKNLQIIKEEDEEDVTQRLSKNSKNLNLNAINNYNFNSIKLSSRNNNNYYNSVENNKNF